MNAADHDDPQTGASAEEPRLTLADGASPPSPVRPIGASRELTQHDEAADDGSVDERRPTHGAPQRLGRYVILGTLGRGGMGTVLEAFDPTLDRRVAVKILHRDLGRRYTLRLLREAQALAKLSHPNVVQVYEAGEVDGQLFIAMEMVRGQTLQQWIEQDPRPDWRRCVETFLQVGAGLAAAHAQGLVHRDFKPSNAIVDPDGRARVLDFGLARQEGGGTIEGAEGDEAIDDDHLPLEPPSAGELELAALETPLTRTGAVLGTPAYMPPEQRKGREVDARSDQFAFCVSLYEALHGERPYVSMTAELVRPPPKGTDVPMKLRQVVVRGLSLDPAARWPQMDALLAELRRLLVPTARRWLGLGLVGGLAAVGLGLGLASWAELGRRCDGATAQLEGVWDDARRQAVRDAILGTELSYATDTWARVQARLDAYSEAWVAQHTLVCEATRVHEVQSREAMDLRMACLGTRRMELRATVGVLAAADHARVEKAVALVESLPALARCDDVEALVAARAELPPPEDPELAAAVQAQREALAEVVALLEGGDYRGGSALAETVVGSAEALGHAPLLAEALLRRGWARERVGEHAKAEEDLEQAYLLALAHEHDEVELEAASRLVYVVGYKLARHERARELGKVALALAERPGTSDTARAAASSSVGVVLQEQGHLDEALASFERALAIDEAALGPDHPRVALDLGYVGAVLRKQGALDEALAHQRRALAIREAALGPRHPAVASSFVSIGAVLFERGEVEEALASFRQGLAIQEAALGPESHEVSVLLANIGAVLSQQGRADEALAHLRRALAIKEQTVGPRHPEVAVTLGNIGIVLEQQGRLDESLAHHERALGILQEVLGPRHRDVAGALSNIGNVRRSQGRLEEALQYHARALGILEEVMGPRHHTVAAEIDRIGETQRARGELDLARASHERALEIVDDAMGPRHPRVALPLLGLAEVALASEEPALARRDAERAVAIREASQVTPAELAEARFVLARALWAIPSQRNRARALARQARDAFTEHEGLEDERAEVVAWLAGAQ